jgi:hypothetical protein
LHSKKATVETEGGTIIFRHWWAPVVNALLQNPQENSTWYATTEIWSDEDCVGKFWIGFNNTSRSMATRAPTINEWDERKSCVWVNGLLIQPPLWKNGGQVIGLETPLTNEGYESRAPTAIPLRKGWNSVLIKCPVGSFRGTDWQNPVKWMFTFVEVK